MLGINCTKKTVSPNRWNSKGYKYSEMNTNMVQSVFEKMDKYQAKSKTESECKANLWFYER